MYNFFEEYEKKEIIGIGPNGIVYKGFNKKTCKNCAIKEIKKSKINNRLLEAININSLNLENIVSIKDIKEDENNIYIIMELCLFNLQTYITYKQILLPKVELNEILFQLNKIFIIIHNINIHKNIKPSNILFSRDEFNNLIVKLSLDVFQYKNPYIFLNNYSPEILENNLYNEKSDIWSLGITIYFMLFKEYPFNGDNKENLLNQIKSNNIYLKNPNNYILDDLITRMLTIDLNQRISWKDYFYHPFFEIKNQKKCLTIETIKENEKYNFTIQPIFNFQFHSNTVNSISIFPSGKIISVSTDKSIKIYNENFIIEQNIENAHNDTIYYVCIKDENNFVTCSRDKNIKTWIKNSNLFIVNKIILNAHNNNITKVIYYKDNLISCSWDKKIKIWEENNINMNYECVTVLLHSGKITSILLLEDLNYLISSGNDGVKFWNLNNFQNLIYIEQIFCGCWNALCRIDKDRIIIGGNEDGMKIISIKEKKIIESLENNFTCWAICFIPNINIILYGGMVNDLYICRSDNYELIQQIKNAHNGNIRGINQLKNGLIASVSEDFKIKIWKIIKNSNSLINF